MTVASGKGIARLLFALMLVTPALAHAQDVEDGDEPSWSVDASLDVASSFVWRGLELSDKPNFQPGIWVDYGSFELGTWGSHEFKGSDGYHEQDFWLSYYLPELPIGSFALTLNDYYINSNFGDGLFDFSDVVDCPDEGVGDPPRCPDGPHTVEVAASFEASAVPVSLLVAYNIRNDPQSALYSEASFNPEVGGFQLGFTAGGVLSSSEWYYETDGAGFTNLGASIGRSLEAGRFAIPITAQIVRNPHHDATYYVISAGLSTAL